MGVIEAIKWLGLLFSILGIVWTALKLVAWRTKTKKDDAVIKKGQKVIDDYVQWESQVRD